MKRRVFWCPRISFCGSQEHTTWVNELLKQQDHRPLEDLRRGCSDGVTLVTITELLCNERPSGIHGLPVLKSHKIQNVVQCLNLLESRGVETEAIKAEELVEGNLKSTLLLMKNIRDKFDSRPTGVVFSGQQSSTSSYSPQSSTPSNWTEKPKAMPGSEFINGGLEMLPGIMGGKEETVSQVKNPAPKMSTTEMDAHGVLQHQHMHPPGHSPDSSYVSKSTPLRGGGQTPLGFSASPLSLPNTMTVEEKLKSLLTNHNNATYDDGELLLPPQPKDRFASFEDDVFENSAFCPDMSPDITVKTAGPSRENPPAGYVPSKPGERQYGPRGEVILDRHHRPPPPYRPRNKPPNQSPPRQQQTPGSPNRRKTPELRDACNRMYGTPQGGPPGHLPQRQPPPYKLPPDTNRMRHPTVPPRNTPMGLTSNSHGAPQQQSFNNHKPAVAPRGPPQKIYAIPNNKALGKETSLNREMMGRDISPNHQGVWNDVSPKRDGVRQDVSPNRDVTSNNKRNGEDVGSRPVSISYVERHEGQDQLNTRVMFDLNQENKSTDWFGGGDKGPGPPRGLGDYGHLREGDAERPVDAEYIEITMESSGARNERGDRSPDRRSPRANSGQLQMAQVTRSESNKIENRNWPPDDTRCMSGKPKGAICQESLRIPNIDMTRNDMAEHRELETSFLAQSNVVGEGDMGKRDSEAGYTVGTIHERQVSAGHPHEAVSGSDLHKATRHSDQNDLWTRDEIDMVAMHNLSMELVKKDSNFDEMNRQHHSASELDHIRNSVDGQQHYPPGLRHDWSVDNRGPQDGRQLDNEASRGAYFPSNQMNSGNFQHSNGQNVLQHGSVPLHGQGRVPYQDRPPFLRLEQRTSFDGSSSLSSDNLPKLGDPFQDIVFDNGLPNIRDFEFSGSEFSSRSVTPPLPPLSPSNTPPTTPPLLPSSRTGFGPPRTKLLSPRQNTPSSRFPQGARKTPDLLSNMEKFPEEVFIDGPGVSNHISITPPGSPHGKYKVYTNPYTPGRVSLPSPKQRRKKRVSKSGKKSPGHHVSFDIDGSTDDTYDKDDSSGSTDHITGLSNITPAHLPNGNNQEISLIRKQLDGLETMYQEILKILGVEKDYLPPGPDGKGKPRGKHRRPPTSKEIKNISKRFARLESHVVTLARSVAHLSSEMRSQNVIFQDLEALKLEVKALKEHRSPGSYHGANEWERLRGWVPSLTNPKRVDKLKRFFGQEPPLLRLFLKQLGYEKYATNFDAEHIGMVELPYMTEERLQSIGIPMGPRLRILQEAHLCFQQENFNIYIV
ncbi:uncharacterized protein LOC135484565 isoform X2 [Lineus longissimus]|uniref:uncharacterized protein LOC135484565 isoform X2 n=1 Tax=Lineus longissimus TaxID=88925 RepID=UPI002B4D537D